MGALLRSLLMAHSLLVADSIMEYYYDQSHGRCDLTPIVPPYVDPTGLVGAPYVTIVDCPETTFWGYNYASFRVYKQNSDIDGMFESTWFEAGAFFRFNLSKGYITGGRFAPVRTETPYTEATTRTYEIGNAVVADDIHVNEGESNTVDLLWTNVDLYQPPLVIVVSCLSDENERLWVRDHFHPKGALYIALVGTPCFMVNGIDRCIESIWQNTSLSAIRWVSPLLRYNESFRASYRRNAFVDRALGYACEYPLAFAVEKFDYRRNDTLPQFEIMPDNRMVVTDDLRPSRLVC